MMTFERPVCKFTLVLSMKSQMSWLFFFKWHWKGSSFCPTLLFMLVCYWCLQHQVWHSSLSLLLCNENKLLCLRNNEKGNYENGWEDTSVCWCSCLGVSPLSVFAQQTQSPSIFYSKLHLFLTTSLTLLSLRLGTEFIHVLRVSFITDLDLTHQLWLHCMLTIEWERLQVHERDTRMNGLVSFFSRLWQTRQWNGQCQLLCRGLTPRWWTWLLDINCIIVSHEHSHGSGPYCSAKRVLIYVKLSFMALSQLLLKPWLLRRREAVVSCCFNLCLIVSIMWMTVRESTEWLDDEV